MQHSNPSWPLEGGHTMLNAALEYAAADLPVFPCGLDKRPLIPDWPHRATKGPEQIIAWWTTWPDAMIGLVTGARSLLYVVDLDVKGDVDGIAAYRALGIPKAEIAARTPSGGGHAYYRWPGGGWNNTVAKIAPGIDTRGEGGYVIAPPSRSASGEYRWGSDAMHERLLAGDVPELPAELRELLGPPGWPFRRDVPATGSWEATALHEELARVTGTAEGTRNHALNTAAFNLGQIVADGRLDRAHVEGALRDAALAAGLDEAEVPATIRSGLDAGAKQPRGPRRERPSGEGTEEFPEPDRGLLDDIATPAPAFPASVFGSEWGPWIADAARCASAPPDYVAMALLSVAGSLVGNACWVHPWVGWSEPPAIWAMLVGGPSCGKSPALRKVIEPLIGLERRVREEAELAHLAWARSQAAASASGGEDEPHIPRLMVNDVTTEKLGAILARQPRGCLMLRDELAGLFGSMNRYNNGGGDRSFWLEAYGGGTFSVERLNRPPVRVERLLVGVAGGIQPDRLASLLMRERDDDGMLARFCPVFPEPVPVTIPDRTADPILAVGAFERLYDFPMRREPDGIEVPHAVVFDEAARLRMLDYYARVRADEGRDAGLLNSFVGKTPGMIARIALILSLLDWAAGDEAEPPVELVTAEFDRAHHFVTAYLLPMARRAYAEAATPAAERAARTLVRLLRDDRIPSTTKGAISSRKLTGLRNVKEIEAALELLVEARILLEQKVPTGGRPRFEYLVNPRIWS